MKKIFLIISIVLFLFSFSQDAFYVEAGNNSWYPLDTMTAFFFGWVLVFEIIGPGISWIANPLLLITWILFAFSKKASILFSLLATFFAISFMFFNEIIIDEGGTLHKITHYGIGYYFWLLSCITMVIGSLYLITNSDNVSD